MERHYQSMNTDSQKKNQKFRFFLGTQLRICSLEKMFEYSEYLTSF